MKKEAYIYTYVNKETKKTYIGSRSKYKGKAEDDFNIKYFSSSNDMQFLEDMHNGLLDGQIVLKIYCENACKRIIEIEANMIESYWKKYGKENSYNHYCNGKFSMAGKNHSEKTKKLWKSNNSKHTMLGKHHNEDTKEKLRQYTGEKSSAYGKKWSEQRRKKLSDSLKGRKISDEAKIKISNANTGKHHTEETKKKISESQKGKKWSEESKEKLRKRRGENHHLYGKKLTDDHKKKCSEALKGRRHTEETKQKIANSNKGKIIKKYIFIDEHNEEHIMCRANAKKFHPTWIEISQA